MPVILNNNRYNETVNPDGSIVRLDKELSIVTGKVVEIKQQNSQNDGLYTWVRGELNDLTSIISDNIHLTSYLRNHNLPFVLVTQMNLKEGENYTFIGHIKQFIYPSGAYGLTIDCNTAVNDNFDYNTIRNILESKKVKTNIIDDLLTKYQNDRFNPVQVIIDIRRGSSSFYLSDYTNDIISTIQRAMDTDGDNLSEAIVMTEIAPYFGGNKSFSKQMYQLYGFDALERLKENPWSLVFDIPRLTFEKCDVIATLFGYNLKTDTRRIEVLVRLAFDKTIKESNYTYIPKEQVNAIYDNYLTNVLSRNQFENLIQNGLSNNLVKIQLGYQPKQLYIGEQNVFSGYKKLANHKYSSLSDKHFDQLLSERQKQSPGFQFAKLQEKAVRQSVESGLFILTGGPGTGKTTTLSSILRAHELHFNYPTDPNLKPIMLVAPTGKAATRMMNQTGRMATTIHRELLINQGGCRDIRYVLEQLQKNDTRLIVIDESSMLDTIIAGTIFDIINKYDGHLKLIIVGDNDQLPSIGAGQILKDLLNHHNHVVTLTEVKRQAGGSNIPELAKMIRQGIFPEKNWFNDKDDIYLIESQDDQHMLKQVQTMLNRRKKFNDLDDFQILTPYVNHSRQSRLNKEKNYDTCSMINHYTQSLFNSPYYNDSTADDDLLKTLIVQDDYNGKIDNNIKRFINNGRKLNGVRQEGRFFRVNDRVVCNHNLNKFISNGTTGILRQIGTKGSDDIKEWSFIVEFEGQYIHEFTYSEWEYLDLAYAITIHKSQGSEYKNVFFPLTRSPRPDDQFLNRNIVYTAITRTQETLVLLGKHSDFTQAVLNQQQERKTGLAEMLKTGQALKEL